MAKISCTSDSSCWWRWGARGTVLHCWWECKFIRPLWQPVWWFLRKMGVNLTQDSAVPLLDIYPKAASSSQRYLPILIAALFMVFRKEKLPRCPSTEEWRKRMWHFPTMEYYSAVKNKKIMYFTGKWMEVEKNIWVSYPRPRKTNMVCIHLDVDINSNVNDNQATVHGTTEVRYRIRD